MVCRSHAGSKTGLDGPFKHGRREGTVDGIRVIELSVGFAWHAATIAFRETYDRVVVATVPFTMCIPAMLAALIRRIPLLLEVSDVWPRGRVMSVLACAVCHIADKLIALSPGMVDEIKKRGVPASRIAMIPNGCDMALFAAPVSAWRPVEVRSDDIMAVYAGAHHAASGLHAALDVAAELKRRGSDHVKLVFIGSGNLKPSLVMRAQQEKLDNVLFLEPVPKTKLAGLMASADIGLQLLANIPAFYYGTSPNKFFDYLASGTPVLCNYPGWIAEMIALHQCGFVVAPDNIKAFADALEYAANNRAELLAMGPRAQQLGRTAFSRDQLAEKFCQWLEGAI
jgi:glycosyltransferase involved in cell wall biosynthesis